MAEGWSDRGWRVESERGRVPARVLNITIAGQYLPPLCTRSLGTAVEAAARKRRCDHRSLGRRFCCGVPIPGRCRTVQGTTGREAAKVLAGTTSRENKTDTVRAICPPRLSAFRRTEQTSHLQLPGVYPLLWRKSEREVSRWSSHPAEAHDFKAPRSQSDPPRTYASTH